MKLKTLIPFINDNPSIDNDNNFLQERVSQQDLEDLRSAPPKVLGISNKNFFNYWLKSDRGKTEFESPEFDLSRILSALDTDSYVRMAISKYKELFWKEGWEIVGENPDAVNYLHSRIDILEYAMNRPFLDLIMEIVDQCVMFSNCFVVKSRKELSSVLGKQTRGLKDDTDPIVAYFIIPTETVKVKVDNYRRPIRYQQNIDDITVTGQYQRKTSPEWTKDEVIHFYIDRKPGRIFGTPFILPVLDDIIALRQMEEDIQNLVHRELHPIYKYIIGTQEQPAEDAEIDNAKIQLESMRAEGGLVMPFRHDLDIIGAEGHALDAEPYLNHFKERVAIGLGLAPHHLGMTVNSANRSLTERLDIALYDRVKNLQKQIAEMIRLFVFDELLMEGGFDPTKNPSTESISDRCIFKFKEIDVDTQVKKETHIIQKYVQGAITWNELRMLLNMSPEGEIEMTQPFIAAKLASRLEAMTNPENPTSSSPKSIDNIIRPKNQYGQKMSPGIKRSDGSDSNINENMIKWFDEIRSSFDDDSSVSRPINTEKTENITDSD